MGVPLVRDRDCMLARRGPNEGDWCTPVSMLGSRTDYTKASQRGADGAVGVEVAS